MAKGLKKKGRRLKRTVRKTLGTICLISAILVATIPVEGLKQVAAEGETDANAVAVPKLDEEAMKAYYNIPDLINYTDKGGTIYSTGDDEFQFAYVAADGTDTGSPRFAVILGYSQVGQLTNDGTLTIPDTVDAYLNYYNTDGNSTSGQVAVGQSGNYLFYRVEVTPETTTTDGSDTPVVIPATYAYNPCYYNDYDIWSKLSGEDLYFYDHKDNGYRPTTSVEEPTRIGDVANKNAYLRIMNAAVVYIGNEYVKTVADSSGNTKGYAIAGHTDENTGIFANRGAIRHLEVGSNLSGIGNYAFYGCSSLQSIKLSNALDTIGNYAFARCLNIHTIDMNLSSDITAIGTHAFEDCQGLTNVTVPINVQAIGDAAFRGCINLRSINLCGEEPLYANVSLRTLGHDMFVNCTNLQSITFPRTFLEDVDISNFQGCLSLQSITVRNMTMNITENYGESVTESNQPAFGYDAFKEQYEGSTVVQGTFYFEGPTQQNNPSILHQTAMNKPYFAFSYLSDADLSPLNIYELTVPEGDDNKAVYRVNNQNQLIEAVLTDGISVLDLPNTIGPYYISTINSNVFANYCSLTKLVVPASVKNIASEAFIGCHNLEHVLFEDPTGLTLGERAFQTQALAGGIHKNSCPTKALTDEPKLTFTGTVSPTSEPFRYAMDPANKINYGDQQKLSYITFYSGWPSNLTVQYNPETDKNELIDYPTLYDLRHASETFAETDGFGDDKEYVYPYMTDDFAEAMTGVIDKKAGRMDESTGQVVVNSAPLTEAEQAVWDAVMNITLPEGIESVRSGLFYTKEVESNEVADGYFNTTGASYKTLTAYGLKEIAGDEDPTDDKDEGAFANWTTLGAVNLYGGTEKIGDYAFKGCKNLTSVMLPDTVTQMGVIPFTGCSQLTHVNFQESEYFTCANSIIYKLDTAGNKYELIEYLEGRKTEVRAGEVEGVKVLAERAFANTQVGYVDLSSTLISVIPEYAFENCEKLSSLTLPNSVKSVENKALTGCPNLQRIIVPYLYTVFRQDAVDVSGDNRPDALTFICHDDSLAHEYAVTWGFATDPEGVPIYYKVVFEDWDGTVLKEESVEQGRDATPPEDPVRQGYVFKGWNKDYTGITGDITITAMYDVEDPDAKKVNVYFYDYDQTTLIETKRVTIGEKVSLPNPEPKRDGYSFVGWIAVGSTKITDPIMEDTTFIASYEELDGRFVVEFIDHDGTILNRQLINPGEAAYEPKSPERSGYTFAGWLPSDFSKVTENMKIYATYTKGSGGSSGPGGDPSGDDPSGGNDGPGGGNEDPDGPSKLYTLTVQNGSGSGSYVAGSQPIIIANDPASGYEFSNWTIDPADTKISSKTLSATVVTMPEGSVVVTAHYKAKSGSSSGSGTTVSGNSSRPNGNANLVSNGTTVVIDKNGLSNTGVVSATVKGSSDNFTIKVSESSAASEAVVKALKAEYGDISNIKYFPMDISLYDSTGTKKITDTTGLTITITLPLPDSLITYAGNNKVAGVVNDRLDKLSPKFTTIDKVACVTFTAEHFSPYVIYVETDNLSKGVLEDNTPKTGDGIHPKWFLSIGLACVAMVLFMKKDKRAQQKVRVA